MNAYISIEVESRAQLNPRPISDPQQSIVQQHALCEMRDKGFSFRIQDADELSAAGSVVVNRVLLEKSLQNLVVRVM